MVPTAVPSFIVTLGTLFAVAGLLLGVAVIVTGTTSVKIQAGKRPSSYWAISSVGCSKSPSFWWIAAAAFWAFVLHYTKYGNWILAMGGDKVSARNAGIPTDRVTILLFMCSRMSAAFVGLSQAILYNSAQGSAGQSYIFNAIISVVVGGVLLTGGYGSIFGIVLGTLTFAIVNQGIYYTAFDANWASLNIGILLLVAVLMNNTFRKMALSYAPKKTGAKA